MSHQFDAARALREEIQGISEVVKTFALWETEAEGKLTAAELRLSAVQKMAGFARSELARKREVLRLLEKAGEKP